MAVDPTILVVQEHDSEIDRISHEMRIVAEIAERDELLSLRVDLEARRLALEELRGAPQSELARLDDEVAMMRAKLEREESKLGSGAVASARELTGLQAEVESLQRRISDLEDRELEAMEQLEASQPDLDALDAELAGVEEALPPVEARLKEQLDDLGEQLSHAEGARDAAAAGVADDLLDKYERVRVRSLNGVGAARLVDGSCGGCHVKLAAGELVEAREAALARCPSCEAILVIEEA